MSRRLLISRNLVFLYFVSVTKAAKSKIMSQCGQFGRYQNPGFPFDGSSDQAISPEASPNGGFPEVKIGSHNICFSFSGCFVVLGWVGPSGSPGRLSHFGQTSFTTGLASLKYDRGKLYQGIHDLKNGRGLRKLFIGESDANKKK